ncbi:unnamed protein product [Arabis nemorensis]|uniref:Snurportin-1 n=1 Tax=Arabis nemorensis TaxID=586526 RepID=A0A565CG71_9BRAS|nr:unnamed protein product [Arabis nemorensis]
MFSLSIYTDWYMLFFVDFISQISFDLLVILLFLWLEEIDVDKLDTGSYREVIDHFFQEYKINRYTRKEILRTEPYNCWGYVATDLFSARRLITGEDSVYRTFSVRYLTFYASEMLRSIAQSEGEKHHCHGFTIARALKFIRDKGVPEEDPIDAEQDFDCVTDRPEENPPNMYQLGEDVEIRESDKLQDLYDMILYQPVGANLHCFEPEISNIGSEMYVGATSNESVYSGLHTVEIVAIRRVNGKLVAIVKNSHGVGKGKDGYIMVSLTRMVIGMGQGNELYSASLLLTNFSCPVIPRPREAETGRENKKKKTCSYSKNAPLVKTTPEWDIRQQLMLPEWMINIPDNLSRNWFVLARPAGKRCFVVSSDGTTVSRVRDGSILHRFPSALPGGSRKKGTSGPSQSYTILDCIFHEEVVYYCLMQPDQTYYVIDMICWRGYSLYEWTAEFRFFWVQSKLAEIGACDPPSFYHKFRFSTVPFHNCDQSGLHSAYTGSLPYVKDGLLFYNKQAHYHTGNTPLVLIWKDDKCSQCVMDTDYDGKVPKQHVIVLELEDDGKLVTSDDPPVALSCLNEEESSGLPSGSRVRVAAVDGGLSLVDGRLEKANLQYISVSNRAFADSYSKIMFQHKARNSPLKIEDLAATISHENQQEDKSP